MNILFANDEGTLSGIVIDEVNKVVKIRRLAYHENHPIQIGSYIKDKGNLYKVWFPRIWDSKSEWVTMAIIKIES